MSGDDTANYAPKSPDLSSFYSAGPTQPASLPPSHSDAHYQDYQHHQNHAEYKLQSPVPSSSTAYAYTSNYHPPSPQESLAQPPSPGYSNYAPTAQHHHYSPVPLAPPPVHTSHPQQPYSLQPAHFAPAPFLISYQDPHHSPPCPSHPHSYASNFHSVPPHEASPSSSDMPPRKAAAAPPPAPVIEPSPVRTKFPTARIKRIMQADEEVGKVAQQTPIAVGKALELFMIQLVTKSADVAKDKGSKRITAQMLKQVVETDEQWDFLREIVGRVENEKEGSKAKAKPESESEEEIVEPKKKGRGGRRKKSA
ncbi:hypothetical protein S7711_03039 [Stachybotrys chartarum IBT 7711]|uniref:NCT transcriptional regulatory complex subunit A n=1 Tax=Stachybotrys chartarum (strain CBS 109288 / IBT 7711) TaxID=1280523 RepID=A0A084APF0_STACB|nr:hypothetical protein S7711_03039 [Stachybotrys chartarum IBT 7711]